MMSLNPIRRAWGALRIHVRTWLLFILGIALVVVSALARATPVMVCPDEIAVRSSMDAPKGWTLNKASKLRPLEAIMVFAGDISPGAQVAPTVKRTEQGREISEWLLYRGTATTNWMTCHYEGTSEYLSRKLTQSAERCTLKVIRLGSRIEYAESLCQ